MEGGGGQGGVKGGSRGGHGGSQLDETDIFINEKLYYNYLVLGYLTDLFRDDLTPPNTLRNEMLWQWFEAKCILRSVLSTGKFPHSSQGRDWARDSE